MHDPPATAPLPDLDELFAGRPLLRLQVWARFLPLASRMELNSVPVHPDRAAGIGFAGHSVVYGASPMAAHQDTIIGVVAVAVVLFTAPLLMLSPRLMQVPFRTQLAALAGLLH